MSERPPRRTNLAGRANYRIVPARLPMVEIFERLVDPDELEVLYALEALSNDRLQAQAGNLFLVPKDEWVTGPHASVVMAAFTHVGRESRFSDGTYGVYYAGLDEETAIAETVFHAERRLRDTDEPAIELEMRCFIGTVQARLDDIRGDRFKDLQSPDLATWPTCQAFGRSRRDAGADGLYYLSARRPGGTSIAAFRPKAVSLPTETKYYRYGWNGARIDRVMTVSELRVP